MVRVFCIIPLALAAVSAVSGHVIGRRQHKAAPTGWETSVLQNYTAYHERYLKWDCQNQHNTTFFDKCCHPLLKNESISVLEKLGCNAPGDECDDGNSSVPPSSTSSTPPQPAYASTSPPASSSPPSEPATDALAKADDTPSPSPSPTPSPTTPTYTPPKSSSSPPPAQTSGSGSGGDVLTGGEATFFFQNGVAGACGQVHQDTDMICAIDSALYSQTICGKSVFITNTQTGQSITVVVADECPTCKNANSIDLSHTAFGALTDSNFNEGVAPIKWNFID